MSRSHAASLAPNQSCGFWCRGLIRALLLALLALWLTGCGKKPPPPRPANPAPTPTSVPDRPTPGRVIQEGIASWYGPKFHGRLTANGEVYDMYGDTAAHRTLAFNTWVLVENLDNGKSTIVRINDRGPFIRGRVIDLSKKAAQDIGMIGPGVARVRLRIVDAPGMVASDVAAVQRNGYIVQVGAFSLRENAERLAQRLSGRFDPVDIQTADIDGRTLHRVRVGCATTLKDAQRMSRQLSRVEGVSGTSVFKGSCSPMAP